MEKLTLRQLADVIKALVEADMPKEAGFTLKVVESGDKEKADGQKVELVCTKEEKKEDTKKTDSVEAYSSEYCSAEITYDMNADYRECWSGDSEFFCQNTFSRKCVAGL